MTFTAPGRPARGRRRARRFLEAIAISGAASLLAAAAASFGLFSRFEALLWDVRIGLNERSVEVPIVVVEIDESAFREMDSIQPLDRGYLADLLSGLAASGPRAIGVDILFADRTDPGKDAKLSDVIAMENRGERTRIVVASTTFDIGQREGELVRLIPGLSTEWSGLDKVYPDRDGVVRWMRPVQKGPQDAVRPTLAAALLLAAARKSAAELPVDGTLPLPGGEPAASGPAGGEPSIQVSPNQNLGINFAIKPEAIPHFSATVVRAKLRDPGSPDFREFAELFRDRFVLVGGTFEESRDFLRIPPRGDAVPGVYLHAVMLASLLTRTYLLPPSPFWNALIQVLLCAGISACFALLRPTRALVGASAFVAAAFLPLAWMTLRWRSSWFDPVTPLLALGVANFVMARVRLARQRRRYREYLSREVADQVIRDPDSLRGKQVTASVLFTDLRDFTMMSEKLAPAEVAEVLNAYFPSMIDAVQRYHGVVLTFIGDALLGVFGTPIADVRHADSAVAAARDMIVALEALNRDWAVRGLPQLRMGVGIHTGAVFAGEMGSDRRKIYTVLGDAVNVAARVEGLNKELKTCILLTRETQQSLSETRTLRDAGEHKVKGRAEPVWLFEVPAEGAGAPA